jgi:hypothetical protein
MDSPRHISDGSRESTRSLGRFNPDREHAALVFDR